MRVETETEQRKELKAASPPRLVQGYWRCLLQKDDDQKKSTASLSLFAFWS